MSNEVTITLPPMPFEQMERLARYIAQSGMFGIKTVDQAMVLMQISQAEGRHPALAARDYDIIHNRPSKKAEAMMRDFLQAGGKVEWHKLENSVVDATFSHPQGGTVRITWDDIRVKQAGLDSNPMHLKYPRQMKRSRTVSEGVRTVWPLATSGFYVPEEVDDFVDVTPPRQMASYPARQAALQSQAAVDQHVSRGAPPIPLMREGQERALKGTEELRQWWMGLSSAQRGELGARGRSSGAHMEHWKEIAAKADAEQASGAPLRPEQPVDESDGSGGLPASPPADVSTAPAANGSAEPVRYSRDYWHTFSDNIMERVEKCRFFHEVQELEAEIGPQMQKMHDTDHIAWISLQNKIDRYRESLAG